MLYMLTFLKNYSLLILYFFLYDIIPIHHKINKVLDEFKISCTIHFHFSAIKVQQKKLLQTNYIMLIPMPSLHDV